MISFVQFLRPDGRTRPYDVERPADIEALAARLRAAGVVFEAEVLTTGDVSLTAERGDDLLAIEVVPNGPEVLNAVDTLIKNAAAARWE